MDDQTIKEETERDVVVDHFRKLIEASVKGEFDVPSRLMDSPPPGVSKGEYPPRDQSISE